MNITIGTGKRNAFRHGKGPYIVAACGIALVAAAAIVGTTWRTGSNEAPIQPSARIPRVSYSETKTLPQTMFFVVSTEEEASKLDSALSADSANWVIPIRTQIMVVDSPEKEQALATTQLELMESGYPYQLSDLRQPSATPPATLNERSVADTELNDRIMQGVISSEHAAWTFYDEAEAPPR